MFWVWPVIIAVYMVLYIPYCIMLILTLYMNIVVQSYIKYLYIPVGTQTNILTLTPMQSSPSNILHSYCVCMYNPERVHIQFSSSIFSFTHSLPPPPPSQLQPEVILHYKHLLIGEQYQEGRVRLMEACMCLKMTSTNQKDLTCPY